MTDKQVKECTCTKKELLERIEYLKNKVQMAWRSGLVTGGNNDDYYERNLDEVWNSADDEAHAAGDYTDKMYAEDVDKLAKEEQAEELLWQIDEYSSLETEQEKKEFLNGFCEEHQKHILDEMKAQEEFKAKQTAMLKNRLIRMNRSN